MLTQIFLDPQLSALFQQQPLYVISLILVTFAALVVCISIHEFAHAYSADKLGDPTARYLGRVTLNPKAHLDPAGTLLLLVAGFGWGRPVPFDPTNLKDPKRDAAIISFAGPLSNFLLAMLFAVIFHLLPEFTPGTPLDFVQTFVYLVIFYNLVLGFFNLIPVHPLDGFKIMYGLLPRGLALQWMQLAPYGLFILIFLIFFRFTSVIIDPFINLSLALLGIQ